MQITNRKIKSLKPEWSQFRGASVIFDQFGQTHERSGVSSLYMKLSGISNALYQDAWGETYGYCPLPPETYHVTVADLINDGNIQHVREARREDFGGDRIRPGREAPPNLVRLVNRSGVLNAARGPIYFRPTRIAVLNGSVLAALLTAIPTTSWRLLIAARCRLNELIKDEFGLASKDYIPHVSMGYFANKSLAEQAADALRAAPSLISLDHDEFSIACASIFIFEDMSAFRRFPGIQANPIPARQSRIGS